ncbi:hypothetical protein GmRootA79_41800 [Acidovorax sp. A79]|uniref:hypothetical protein n=1 Tax=Acidovorax sp. A79 TaxID=3056107 RepID=UPI0034E8C5D8
MRHVQHTLPTCLAVATLWGAAGIATVAHAQTPAPFVGIWTVAWQGVRTPQQARLVITESGGTYKSNATSRDDPCVGKQVPIVLEDVDGEEATVLLKFSEALHGCTDRKLKIKKVDDKNMMGSFGKTAATITRD